MPDLETVREYFTAHPTATYQEAADALGVKKQNLHYLCIHHGIRNRVRNPVPGDELRAFAKANPKATYRQIAQQFGMSRDAVARRFRRMGLGRAGAYKQIDDAELLAEIKKTPDAPLTEIGARLGTSADAVSARLRALGLRKPRERKIDDSSLEKILSRPPIPSLKELAARFGCSMAAISKAKHRILHPKEQKKRKTPNFVEWKDVEKILKKNPNISAAELGRRLDIGLTALYKVLHRHNALRGHQRAFDRGEMKQLISDGMSAAQVAARFGVSKQAIYNAFRAEGIRISEFRKNLPKKRN